ncbi:MAG: site-specific DNA-methyltransferase [Candidatus Bathyarchaeia archaeon]
MDTKDEEKEQAKQGRRLNELDGRTWEKYSISVWNIIKSPEESKLKHPAMFPLELCKRLLQIYTKKGDIVMDPFMGSGSTIVAARDLERKGVGFDINPEFVKIAKKRLSQQKLVKLDVDEPLLVSIDASNLLDYVKPNSIDLVITSPPYWNIHTRKRTADYKEPRPYSFLKRDLGNISDYEEFLRELKTIFEKVYVALKPGKKCIVIVMDIRQGSMFIPFHMDICDIMEQSGYILEDIIIWNREKEYSNLRPLGYPYVFIVNKIHEYILIFRKNRESEIFLNKALSNSSFMSDYEE